MFKIGSYVDSLLNSITMYRLVLYSLLAMVLFSFSLSFLKVIHFTPLALALSLCILTLVCWITNIVFSKLLKAPTNHESVFITALILYFVMLPPAILEEIVIVAVSAVLAIASKYILAIKRRHIFNPVAISAFLLGAAGYGYAVWWVGSLAMLPITIVAGLLIVRKIHRFSLFFSFLATTLISMAAFTLLTGASKREIFAIAIASWPVVFFGTVMLTEPLTTPPGRKLQMIYGALVGILFGSQFHYGPIYPTPEFALIIGNIFSYVVSSKDKLFLQFKDKTLIAKDTYEFVFTNPKKFLFVAGQYLEWTLPNVPLDARGNRRYFTIASSPTSQDIKLGVKFNPNSSKFKETLLSEKPGSLIVASQLSGDFVLPKDPNKKLVFIAGGIGITPYISMINYLLEAREKRSIVLFYSNKTADEIAYEDLLTRAEQQIGAQIVYIIGEEAAPANWQGEIGHITQEIIKKHVPDFSERFFYISGPNAMVNAYRHLLTEMKLKNSQIKTDYFPGF